jgi:mono/diheme cytochrome c family protein
MRINPKLLFIPGLLLAISLGSCYYDNEEDLYPGGSSCDTTNVTYSGTVAPIFQANCNACHGGSTPSAGLATDSYSAVSANIDRISGAINHLQGYSPMPQGGDKLSDCDLARIRRWINLGKPNN